MWFCHTLPLHNITMKKAVDTLVHWTLAGETKQVSFLNAHCVNVAQEDPVYRAALRASDLILADGIGVKLAYRCQGGEIADNVNGTDLFPLLCRQLQEAGGARVFLMGGRPGVAEGVKCWVQSHFPNIQVVGAEHGYRQEQEQGKLVDEIARSGAQLVLVAMGVPRQERWIAEHLTEIGAVVLGVGGLFDFFSGRQKRAPEWIRRSQLEWVYRLWREPRRMWKRYLVGNLVFLARLVWITRAEVGDTLLRIAEPPSPS